MEAPETVMTGSCTIESRVYGSDMAIQFGYHTEQQSSTSKVYAQLSTHILCYMMLMCHSMDPTSREGFQHLTESKP